MAEKPFSIRLNNILDPSHGVPGCAKKKRLTLTRRNLLKGSSATAAALALLPVEGRGQSGGTSIASNFNGTPVPAGDWVWFTAVLKVHGLDSSPVTIGFMSSNQFSVNGTQYVIPVPAASLTFSPNTAGATTAFINGQWITTVPVSGLAGNVSVTGVALQSPSPYGLPGGINPVTWQGTFTSMTPGLTVDWQCAAAVYDSPAFGIDYTQLGVKPVDDNKASVYQNSDHAGTPENLTIQRSAAPGAAEALISQDL